jgi:hypothetical protein
LKAATVPVLASAVGWENAMYGKGHELDVSNAATAVLAALLKALVDKNLLTNADVRALLTNAAEGLGPHEYVAPEKGAIGIILDDMLPVFPDSGGD